MKISDLSTRQQIVAAILICSVLGIGALVTKPEAKTATVVNSHKPSAIPLEKWKSSGGGKNVAILLVGIDSLTENQAIELALDQCQGKCQVAYFYSNEQAYNLHAFKRTNFSDPYVQFNGDMKKMIKAEEKWKKEDNHWKTVQDGLVARLAFDEFVTYPLR